VSKTDEHKRDHSLYVAFAPVENPTIALALIVENAGWGSGAAAPIARRVFDYWLMGQYPNEHDMAAVTQGPGHGTHRQAACWLPTCPGLAAWRQCGAGAEPMAAAFSSQVARQRQYPPVYSRLLALMPPAPPPDIHPHSTH
jgi:penicillin-binding protein 2